MQADLGIVFDTDVDRSAVVASSGDPINSNKYIALMSFIALRCAGGAAWKLSDIRFEADQSVLATLPVRARQAVAAPCSARPTVPKS